MTSILVGGKVYNSSKIASLAFLKYTGNLQGYATDDVSSLKSIFSEKVGFILIDNTDFVISYKNLEEVSKFLTSPAYIAVVSNRHHSHYRTKEFNLVNSEPLDDDHSLYLNVIVYNKLKTFKSLNIKGDADYTVLRMAGAIGDTLQGWMVAHSIAKERPDKIVDFICYSKLMPLIHPMISQVSNMRGWYVDIINETKYNTYAEYLGHKCKNFINLAHSIESILVKVNPSPEFFWSDDQRRRMCQTSYNNNIALQGGVSPSKLEIIETEEEKVRYGARRKNDKFVEISWSLRGSAVHKWYPFTTKVITSLLKNHPQNLRINLLTDKTSDLMVEEILKCTPVAKKCNDSYIRLYKGNLSNVRESILISKYSDLVIGPETGIMVALCHSDVKKILIVSHSSPENFSDWDNTEFIIPDRNKSPCWPCHRVHYGFEHCFVDDIHNTGSCLCQATISPSEVYRTIIANLGGLI